MSLSATVVVQSFGAETPKDMPPDYIKTIQSAMRAFSSRDFKTAIALVDKSEAMYHPTAMTVNVRAAIAIEDKKFDEGREFCVKALQLDPKFFPALFNLAEIPFMQGKYAEARLAYEKLLDDESSVDLIKFRLYLTYLLEKNDEVAKQLLEKIPLLNDSPIYFYGYAAWEFAHGDEKKAQSYLNSAETVFPKSKRGNFLDVFYDIGWMKRPTGAEQ
ncbi:MAG: tetratricopeptide repeat protein [Chthoniobacteraceae bacterium]